jgi:light-harvesting protein B-800-850 beta chain
VAAVATNNPRAGSARKAVFQRRKTMADPNKVWPTGLTEAESEEIHRNLIQGTQIFGMIAVLAHLLAYIYSPWLK